MTLANLLFVGISIYFKFGLNIQFKFYSFEYLFIILHEYLLSLAFCMIVYF